MKTLTIIKKNLRLLVRSKSSALIVIFGPLFLIFLVGIAFDNANSLAINIGFVENGHDAVKQSFIDALKDEDYRVREISSEDDCLTQIKRGELHLCIVFPEKFDLQSESIENDLTFYVDYSKTNLVWAVLNIVNEQVTDVSGEISMDLTSILLEKIKATQEEIRQQKPILVKFTTENTEAIKEVNNIAYSLNSLDFNINLSDFRLQETADKSQLMVELTGYVVDRSREVINDMKETTTSNGNITAESKEAIDTSVAQTNQWLINIEKQITNESANLQELVDNINNNFDDLEKRLEFAENTQSSVTEKVGGVKTTLTNSLNAIVGLQASLNKIDSDIEDIRVRDAGSIVNPVTTTLNPIVAEKSQLDYIFPSLIVLLVMFTALLLSATVIMMERSSKAYFRTMIAPISSFQKMLAVYGTVLVVIFIQSVIILAISAAFFSYEILFTMHLTLFYLFLSTTLFTFMGIALGKLFRSEETVTLAAVSLGSIFLLLSGVVLPLESMPPFFLSIAKVNPFVISEFLLKESLLFQVGMSEVAHDVLFMIVYVLIMIGIVFAIERLSKHFYLAKYNKAKNAKKKE